MNQQAAQHTPHDITRNKPAGLAIVALLAALAGAVDACGLSVLNNLYVSFMSGNTTQLASALARADWPRAGLAAGIVALFVAGAVTGTVAATLVGHYHLPVVLVLVGGVLAVPLAVPGVAVPALTFGMGMLNAAMQHAGTVKVSITYVTGALVKFSQGLGLLLCGQRQDWAWLEQGVPWVGLVLGAAAVTLGLPRFGAAMFAALPVAALLMAAATWLASSPILPRSRRPQTIRSKG